MRNVETRLASIAERWDELIANLHDPVLFEGMPREEAIRWFSYFFALPKRMGKRPVLRTHVLALYDPFARRSIFPAGIRFSCNIYIGCAMQCVYCYIQTYFEKPQIIPHSKQNFSDRLENDFRELDLLYLPVTPLHFSNSTDALQEHLENKYRHTLYLLQRLAQGEQRRFYPIRLLTRNPARLLRSEYLETLIEIKDKLTVQVSIPILDPEAGSFMNPTCPPPVSV